MKLLLCLFVAFLSGEANTLSWSLDGFLSPPFQPFHLAHAGAFYDLGDGITSPRCIATGSDFSIGCFSSGLFITEEDGNRYRWIIGLSVPVDYASNFTVPANIDASFDGEIAGEGRRIHIQGPGLVSNAVNTPEPGSLIFGGIGFALIAIVGYRAQQCVRTRPKDFELRHAPFNTSVLGEHLCK